MIRFQDSRPDHWAHGDLWGPTEIINDSPKPRRGLYPIAVYAILLSLAVVFLFVATAAAVRAHSWYPAECCHDQDCAPVDSAVSAMGPYVLGENVDTMTPLREGRTMLGLPYLVVTTRHGTAAVPQDMTRRPSPDGRLHACIRNGKVICLFVPPGM